MAIEAQLFDGTIVEFPDDTDRSVIEKTVKKLTAERQEKEPKEETSTLRRVADQPINFAQGVVSGVRAISDAFGADNPISKNLRGVEDYVGSLLSAQAQDNKQEIARILAEAKDKGVLDQVKDGFSAFMVAPADVMVQAFGTVIPTLVGGLAGRAIGLGARATGIGTGAAMGAGVSKGAIYDAVKDELAQTDMPKDQIEQRAILAQEYGGQNLDQILFGTALGGLAAGTGIERALLPGAVKNVMTKAASKSAIARGVGTGFVEGGTEFGQGFQEKVAQNVALQREGFDRPTFQGAFASGTMEGLAGVGLGTGIGALSRPQAAITPPDAGLNVPPPQETPTMDMPAIPQPTPSAPMPLLSADEARQQSYEQQTGRQADLQGGLFQPARGVTAPPMAAPPMDLEAAAQQREQAYQQQMAVQNARQEQAERGNQFMTTPDPYLSQGEAAIQPGQRERAQGLAAQQFGLNVGDARAPITEQDRIDRQIAAQQQMDADRFQQQTPQPLITPAQALPRVGSPTLTPQTARAFDRQADLLGQMQGLPQVEQTGLAAQADIAGRTGQVATPKTGFVALDPMTPREARQRLAVLKDDAPNRAFFIVPHPQTGGRFAIEERVAPVQAAPVTRREDRPSISQEQAVEMVRNVQRTGVLTPEVSAAAQQYGLNIDPMLMNFAERITPENLLVQQRRGMADEAALNAELRGGVATPEEAQRLRETGMGRPYDEVASLEPRAPAALGKGERQRRLEEEAINELNAEKAEFFKNLQGPELWLEGFELGINPKSAIQTASPKFKELFMKPEGRYSLVTTATPETKIAAEKFLKEALPILKRFGLGKVGLRIVDSINGGEADGMYAQQIISLVLDSDNPMGVMRHEVIHALKELGAFTPAEWKVLTKAAKDTWINQFFNRDMQGRYQAEYLKQNGDLEGFQEYLQEEAIAQAFRFFTDPTPKNALALNQDLRPSGMVTNLMRRLNEFFKAIRDFFASKDLTIDEMFLPNRIFADIERGAIQPGRAQGRKEEMPVYAFKPSKAPEGIPQDIYNLYRKYERMTAMANGRIPAEPNAKGVSPRPQDLKREETMSFRRVLQAVENLTSDRSGEPNAPTMQMLTRMSELSRAEDERAEETGAKFSLRSLNPVMRGVAEEVGLTPQEILATSLPLQTGLPGDAAFEKKKLKGIPEVVRYLEDRRRMTGVPLPELDVSNEADRDTLAKLITAEAMAAIRAGGNAIDWYDGVINKTMAVAAVKYPELSKNENAKTAFKLAMAITSQGMNVEDNIKFASNVYEQYRKNNKFPEIGTGGSAKVMKKSFALANDMVNAMGMDTFREFLQKPFTVKDIENLGFKVAGELKSEKVLGSIIFGSKIGFGFYSNLSGNFDPVTMDMWFMRTIGRLTGTLKDFDPARFEKQVTKLRNSLDARGKNGIFADSFDKDLVELARTDDDAAVELARKIISAHEKDYKVNRAGFDDKTRNKTALVLSAYPIIKSMDKPIDAPGSGGVKSNLRKVFAKVRENVKNIYGADIPSAALQALIWYPEQSLYKQLGVKLRVTNQDYAGAMQKLLKQEGYNEQRISAAVKSAAGRRKQVSGKPNAAAEQTTGTEGSGTDAKFSLRDFGSSQSALRPSPSSDAGISFNPVKEDAVSFQGSHYGKARTEVLNGAKYGQGLKGAEARRLEQSDDERIKRRVYFYIPRGNNTMPNREAGVGNYVYTQKLDNILAPGPTMGRLNQEAGGDANKFESLIVDNGYDGYAVPDFGMMVVLNQDVPVKYEGTVDEVHGGKKFSLRAPTTPEFKQWFRGSKVKNPDGTPRLMYHGTTGDITEFKLAEKKNRTGMPDGFYFTSDPEQANDYASKKEGANVIPVYLNVKNPFDIMGKNKITNEMVMQFRDELRKENPDLSFDWIQSKVKIFKEKAQQGGGLPFPNISFSTGAMTRVFEAGGYDGLLDGGKHIVAFEASQVKSAFNQKPTESPDIRFSLRAPKTPEFKRFFGNSKITNPDGTPKVMYHGTARIIDEFIPKQAGAIFVTDNPDFAESFSDDSLQFMVTEQRRLLGKKFAEMSPDDQLQLLKKGYKLGVKQKAIKKADADKDMAAITEDFDNRKYPTNTEFNHIAEFFEEEIKNKLESGQNIMPLYVRAENPFDYENPKHIKALQDQADNESLFPSPLPDDLKRGSWKSIESSRVQELIKEAGFDGFYVKEGGNKNLAVYNPNQIKSAIGNRGTYDETGRILYSLKNAPPNQYTKLTEDPLTEKTINGVIKSAFNAVSNDGTSLRNALVDKFSQLSRTLSSLPLFNNKGELRGDMLLHSYAQATNLIKAGLVSGTPILNKDGTIGIERSDNNLANAERLADKLDTNKNVVESGLTGRGYIATIARNLRGADIIAEDRAAQQLGAQQLARANQMYAALNAEIKTGKLSAAAIAKRQQEINKLRKEGKENSRQKRELQVKPEDIAWAEKQLQMTPEVQDILDIWKEVNTSLVNLYEDTGMIDKETADKYRGQKNYVPLFKSREDLNEEAFFRTGTSPKTASKLKELKGADITRNIWENVTKQYAVMFAAAYENQTRRVSVEQMRSINPDLAKITTKDDSRVNLRFRQDGKDVHAIIENPNDLAAFQSMTFQFGPAMRFFGGFTKVLRVGALLNPMFWLRQLIRDPISASITGQAGIVTPFHSAKEFIAILTRNSEAARILASRGVIGQFDTTVSLNEFLGNVGKNKQAAPGFIQNSIQRLMEIHEASDAATRVAVYKKAKAKALKDGMSEEQAVNYAVFKARESINFALTGNSPALAAARQMIPFLNATIVGLDTLYRAATGYGLNAEEKAAARSAFITRASMMVAMSVAYAVLMSDDDEYNKLPDHVKDNNWLFPYIGADGKKKFIRIPVPYEVGYLFKTLPEVAIRYIKGTSTGKEVAKSIGTGFLTNLPTGGTPVPQFAKPALEAITNHSFFTWNPIESVGDDRLPVAQRGRKASEISKVLSQAGLDKIGLSPAKIDTLTKGYFAEFGNFFNELADAVLAVGSGKERTARDLEDLPFFKSFMADPQADKAVSTFYDHQKTATEVANYFSKMKNEGRVEELQKLIADPEKRQMIVAAPAMKKISDVLSTINKQIGIIDRDQSKSPAERRKMINELELKRNEIANRGVEIARQLGL